MNCEKTLRNSAVFGEFTTLSASFDPKRKLFGKSLNPTNRAQPLITAPRKQLITSQNVRSIISVYHIPSCRTNYLQQGLLVGYVYTFRYICTQIVCSQIKQLKLHLGLWYGSVVFHLVFSLKKIRQCVRYEV